MDKETDPMTLFVVDHRDKKGKPTEYLFCAPFQCTFLQREFRING